MNNTNLIERPTKIQGELVLSTLQHLRCIPDETLIINTHPLAAGMKCNIISAPINFKDAIVSYMGAADGRDFIYTSVNQVSADFKLIPKCEKFPKGKWSITDEDIVQRTWLLLDCDADKGKESASLELVEESRQLARDIATYLSGFGFPMPTVGDSGNGTHLLYPILAPNTQEVTDLIKLFTWRLHDKFAAEKSRVWIDSGVWNAARLIKVWGTKSVKGSEPRYSYPIKLESRDTLVSSTMIQSVIDILPAAELEKVGSKTTGGFVVKKLFNATGTATDLGGGGDKKFDLVSWLTRNGIVAQFGGTDNQGRDKYLVECPWTDTHSTLDGANDCAVFIDDEGVLGFKCLHSHCHGKHWADYRSFYDKDYKDRIETPKLPVVQVNNKQQRILSKEVMHNLLAATVEEPKLFARNQQLVEVKGAQDKSIVDIDKETLRVVLGNYSDFVSVSVNPKTQELIYKNVLLTLDIPAGILAAYSREYDLPELKGITTCPVVALNAEGQVVVEDTPGYLPGAKMFLAAPEGKLDIQRYEPTLENVKVALEKIFDGILDGFPFKNQSSKVHTLCMMLQPIMRPLIAGTTPLYLIDAPTADSGKSLLVNTCASICNPNIASTNIVNEGQNTENEWKHTILSEVKTGKSHIFFDNVVGKLDSAALNHALTAQAIEGRLMHSNQLGNYPNFATWIMTANNAEVNIEMLSRCAKITLDTELEHPESRTGFKCPNPVYTVRKNRAEWLAQLIVLVEYWITRGMPRYAGAATSRHPQWLSVMGGICDCVGMTGIMEGYCEDLIATDPEHTAWREFVNDWRSDHILCNKKCTASDLYTLAIGTEDMFGNVEVPGSLSDIIYGTTHHRRLTSLGKKLERQRGKVFNGYKFLFERGRHTSYSLEKIAESSEEIPYAEEKDWEKSAKKMIDSGEDDTKIDSIIFD